MRRAARTQPAVPAGGCCQLRGQDGDGERLASSYDDDVVLGVEQLSGVGVGRDTLEVLEEGRFLQGVFCGLEDKEGGDEGGEDEVRIFRGGHGVCGVRASGCAVLRLYFRGQQLDTACPCCSALLVFCISHLHSGTTPDKSERLASRQSNRRPHPLGFLFPKRRRSSPSSSVDPTPATSKPPLNPPRRLGSTSRSSTAAVPEQPPRLRTATTMTAAPTFDHYQPQSPAALHAKNNLKAWWRQFTSAQRTKREAGERKRAYFLLLSLLDVPIPRFPQLSTPRGPYPRAKMAFLANPSRRVSNTLAFRYPLPTPTESFMSGVTSPWSLQSRAYHSP